MVHISIFVCMRSWIIVSILIVANFVLKGLYLEFNSLAGDEPYSVYHAQMDLIPVLDYLASGNNPPLYEIMLHFWIDLFGISEFSVRFPSLIFSGASVFFMYQIGKKYLNEKIAIYACLIFILSNYQLSFAHEARTYALLGLLSLASVYYYLGIVIDKEGGSRKQLIGYIIATALLVYSHYFGFFIIVAQLLYLLIHPKLFKQYWKMVSIAAVSIFLLYLPNLIVLFTRVADYGERSSYWLSKPKGLESIYNMLWKFSNAPVVTVVVITVFAIAIGIYMVKRKSINVLPTSKFIFIWFVFVFTAMFLLSYQIPMFHDRYVMPAAIAFPLIVAIALDSLTGKSWHKYFFAGVVIGLFAFTFKPNLTNNRLVKETVEEVKKKQGDYSLVLIHPSSFTLNFSYYYDREIFKLIDQDGSYTSVNEKLSYFNVVGINFISDFDVLPWNHIIYIDASNQESNIQSDIISEISRDRSFIDKVHYDEFFEIWEYDRFP